MAGKHPQARLDAEVSRKASPQSPKASPDESSAPGVKHPCPLCGKTRTMAYRPFCSRRCADVDLGRWLGGAYVIAGDAVDDDEGAAPA